MSAVLIDELIIAEPVRLRVVASPDSAIAVAPRLVASPRPVRPLRLTNRGIAVILALVVGLFVTAVAVVVVNFLAVSDAPLTASGTTISAVVSEG